MWYLWWQEVGLESPSVRWEQRTDGYCWFLWLRVESPVSPPTASRTPSHRYNQHALPASIAWQQKMLVRRTIWIVLIVLSCSCEVFNIVGCWLVGDISRDTGALQTWSSWPVTLSKQYYVNTTNASDKENKNTSSHTFALSLSLSPIWDIFVCWSFQFQ